MFPRMVSKCPGRVTSTSSLDREWGESLFVFHNVTGDDFHDGDVGSCEEADQSHQTDDDIPDSYHRRQTLRVKSYDLEHGREDQSQETAADRADQRDDEVQLRYQDGESTWRTNRKRRCDTLTPNPSQLSISARKHLTKHWAYLCARTLEDIIIGDLLNTNSSTRWDVCNICYVVVSFDRSKTQRCCCHSSTKRPSSSPLHLAAQYSYSIVFPASLHHVCSCASRLMSRMRNKVKSCRF